MTYTYVHIDDKPKVKYDYLEGESALNKCYVITINSCLTIFVNADVLDNFRAEMAQALGLIVPEEVA